MILKCSDLPPCEVYVDSHGKFGSPEPGWDSGVSQRQCWNRFQRTEPDREVYVVAVHSGRAEVLFVGQEAARHGTGTDGQGRGVEHAADQTLDSSLPQGRRDTGSRRNAATIPDEIHS